MAVENYNPIILQAGECLDQDWFEPTYESLSALEQAAKNGAGSFECVHFTGHISGDTSVGELCEQAIPGSDMPTEYLNGDQICCLIVSFSGSMIDPAVSRPDLGPFSFDDIPEDTIHYPYQDIDITIKCSGQSVASGGGHGMGVLSATLDPTVCDFNQGIEICADAYTDFPTDSTYTLKWCGCLICVQCPPLPLDNYYIPKRPPNVECEYGLADLSLVIHVLNQMNAAFRCSGYEVECITRDQIESSTPIASDLTTEAKWVGIACTQIQWSGLPSGSDIRSNVSMGCSNRPIACNNSTSVSEGFSFGSAEFFSVACGECQPGESIFFGSSPEYHCAQLVNDEEDEEDTDVVVEGKSDMVFFVFRKQVNELPNVPQLSSGCIFDDTAEAITIASEAINQVACNVKKLNKNAIPFADTKLDKEHSLIVAPSTDPDLPVPIPVKKWVIYGTAQAIADPNTPTIVGLPFLGAVFNYQIKCGGNVVKTSPNYKWVSTAILGQPATSFKVPICAIIDCPVDQPIEICMNVLGDPTGVQIPGAGTFYGTAMCISQADA